MPGLTGVDEIVVTGPGGPDIASPDDLAGQEVWVRASSSYHESLQRLDRRLRAAGRPGIRIHLADEFLEDEDLLEMANAGLVPMIVVDSHKAGLWVQVFSEITLHPKAAVRTGGEIAWAIRKESPGLRAVIDEFIRGHKKGTLFGNILFKRYYVSTRWARNALAEEEVARFRHTVELFRRYAAEYDFDYLLVMAQGYQESRLDQSVRSSAGAIGVMQLLPSTAADPAIGIPEIEELEANIHAGVKYLRHIHETYLADADLDPLNRHLFAFAAYNAGPNRVRRLRQKAAEMGLDPNVWFGNVEMVAARDIGRETVQYVGNISKYYVAYRLLAAQLAKREEIR